MFGVTGAAFRFAGLSELLMKTFATVKLLPDLRVALETADVHAVIRVAFLAIVDERRARDRQVSFGKLAGRRTIERDKGDQPQNDEGSDEEGAVLAKHQRSRVVRRSEKLFTIRSRLI